MACSSCSGGNSLSSCGCIDNCPTKTSEFTFDGVFSSIPVPPGSTLNEVLLLMETFTMNSIGDLNFNYELTTGNCLELAPGTYSYQQMIDAISAYMCSMQEAIVELQGGIPLVWNNIELVNGWYEDDPINNSAQYAVQNGLMYLKGIIIAEGFNPSTDDVFWDSAPITSRQIYTSVYELPSETSKTLRVHLGEASYQGSSAEVVVLTLDSVPVIRLTN